METHGSALRIGRILNPSPCPFFFLCLRHEAGRTDGLTGCSWPRGKERQPNCYAMLSFSWDVAWDRELYCRVPGRRLLFSISHCASSAIINYYWAVVNRKQREMRVGVGKVVVACGMWLWAWWAWTCNFQMLSNPIYKTWKSASTAIHLRPISFFAFLALECV